MIGDAASVARPATLYHRYAQAFSCGFVKAKPPQPKSDSHSPCKSSEAAPATLRGAKTRPLAPPSRSGLLKESEHAGKARHNGPGRDPRPRGGAQPVPPEGAARQAGRAPARRAAGPRGPEEAAEAPAAAPAVEAPAGAAAADGLPPDDASDGESAESDALGETLSLPRAPTPVVDAGDPEDEDGGDYFYGDDDDDDASDADAPGSDAVLARELAEQFALEDLQEQRRELLGGLAMTLVARANSASRAVHSPRQLVRHRELLAQVSESMDLLHSLMPALEATGWCRPLP